MAKFKINAGAEIEMVTKDELRGELQHAHANWMTEVSKGVRWRRASMFGTSDGAGAVTIGAENSEQKLTPGEGFAWLVRRIAVTGYDPVAPSTHALAVYQGAVSNSAIIIPKLTATYASNLRELLMPADSLVVSGTATASTKIWVTVQVQEVPVSLLWRL